MNVSCPCPECGAVLSVPEERLGQTGPCGVCGKTIHLPDLRMKCPACDASIYVPNQREGLTGKCNKCGVSMTFAAVAGRLIPKTNQQVADQRAAELERRQAEDALKAKRLEEERLRREAERHVDQELRRLAKEPVSEFKRELEDRDEQRERESASDHGTEKPPPLPADPPVPSLVPCPMCGNGMSPFAHACPKCGHPMSAPHQGHVGANGDMDRLVAEATKKKRRWFLPALGIAVAVVCIVTFLVAGRNMAGIGSLSALRERMGHASTGAQEITIQLPGGIPLTLVRIPAGASQMGSPDTERGRDSYEGPVHTVNIGYDFYMGKYEVTQAQWLAIMPGWQPENAPSTIFGLGYDYPAYHISWLDAQDFIAGLNAYIRATRQGPATMRLPSEAEWEYACRAGTQTRFCFGDSLSVDNSCEDDGIRSRYMWYCGNTFGSRPVGSLLPNAFGLFDMHGNVWEWCEDQSHGWFMDGHPGGYAGAPSDGSAWTNPPGGSGRVNRGGCWFGAAEGSRSAIRHMDDASYRSHLVGFRLASSG